MARLASLTVLPLVAAAALLGAGTASASVVTNDVSAMAACEGTPSWQGATWTWRCSGDAPGTEFRAVNLCPNGDYHYGAWVLQGPGRVSVATCGNPAVNSYAQKR